MFLNFGVFQPQNSYKNILIKKVLVKENTIIKDNQYKFMKVTTAFNLKFTDAHMPVNLKSNKLHEWLETFPWAVVRLWYM